MTEKKLDTGKHLDDHRFWRNEQEDIPTQP